MNILKYKVNSTNPQNKTRLILNNRISPQTLHQILTIDSNVLNKKDEKDQTFLSYAIKQNDSEIFDLILSYPNINFSYKDKNGNTYLHLAVINQNINFIKKILSKTTNNINLQNKKGNTPLHIAYRNGKKNIINILLNKGSDTSIKNNDGKTPVEMSRINSNNISRNKIINAITISSSGNTSYRYKSKEKFNTEFSKHKNTEYKVNNIKKGKNLFKKKIKKNNITKYPKKNSTVKINLNENYIEDKNIFFKMKTNVGLNERYYNNKNLINIENFSTDLKNSNNLYKNSNLNKTNNNKITVSKSVEQKKILMQNNEQTNKTIKIKCNENIVNINNYNDFHLHQKTNNKNVDIEKDSIVNYEESLFEQKKSDSNMVKNIISDINNLNILNSEVSSGLETGSYQKSNLVFKKISPKNFVEDINNSNNYKTNKFDEFFNNNKKCVSNFQNNMINEENYKYSNEFNTFDEVNFKFEDSIINQNKNNSNNDLAMINIKDNNTNENNNTISLNYSEQKIKQEIKNVEIELYCQKCLQEFLSQINMLKYYNLFINSGFDDINLIIHQSLKIGVSIKDFELKEIGIILPGDRAKILIRIQEKSENFCYPVPKSVYYTCKNLDNIEKDQHIMKLKYWLKSIRVDNYLQNFIKAGYHSIELLLLQMESNNPLSNEILKDEIGIDKTGHRNRILNKLKDDGESFDRRLKANLLDLNNMENEKNCYCLVY